MAQDYKIINQITTTDGGITDTSSEFVSTTATTASFSGISASSITGGTYYGSAVGLTDINLANTYGQLPLSSTTSSFIQNEIIVGKSGAGIISINFSIVISGLFI